MIDLREVRSAPRVTVVLTTWDTPGGRAALRSALRQTYSNLEIIVAGGGQGDAECAAGLADPRVRRLRRPAQGGEAASLNEALRRAEGRYVCYLDDRSQFYGDHVRVLVEALETGGDGEAAYSDFYCTLQGPAAERGRQVLGKVLLGGRDFDRFFLFHYHYVPRAALMHRRDLLERTGPYAEEPGDLLDWDMHRRMALFTDFVHVPRITGEISADDEPGAAAPPAVGAPAADERLEAALLAVRRRRPGKPWPKARDLAVVFAPSRADADAAARIAEIHRWTYVPYRLYLAAAPDEARRLGAAGPELVHVPVEAGWPWDARVDKALRLGEADCVAVLPPDGDVDAAGIEACAYVLEHHAEPGQAVRLPSASGAWGAVFRTDELLRARRNHPALSLRRSVEAAGLATRSPRGDELPFDFDQALRDARAAEADGNFLRAARTYEALARKRGNTLWMKEAAACALYRDEQHDPQALEACQEVNRHRPTVSSLLLEARLCRRNDQVPRAARLLEQAREVLTGTADVKEPPC